MKHKVLNDMCKCGYVSALRTSLKVPSVNLQAQIIRFIWSREWAGSAAPSKKGETRKIRVVQLLATTDGNAPALHLREDMVLFILQFVNLRLSSP